MIHPRTEVRRIDHVIGYGVFALDHIPRGTITYVRDPLEIVVSPESLSSLDSTLMEMVRTYSYVDACGNRIVSWDIAKYMNHSCEANTLTTGYDFEIAIRDIAPNEELTDDYGLLNLDRQLLCSCGSAQCRRSIGSGDFDKYTSLWDSAVIDALLEAPHVAQPLMPYVDQTTSEALWSYLREGRGYRSVLCQRCLARQVDEYTRDQVPVENLPPFDKLVSVNGGFLGDSLTSLLGDSGGVAGLDELGEGESFMSLGSQPEGRHSASK